MARPKVHLHKWISTGFTKKMLSDLEKYKRQSGVEFVGDAIRSLLQTSLSGNVEKDLVEAKELLRMVRYQEITKENQQEVLDRVDKLIGE